MVYDLRPLKLPRTAGGALKLLTVLSESGITGGLVAGKFFRDIGITALRAVPCDEPPAVGPPLPGGEPPAPLDARAALPEAGAVPEGFPFETAADFTAAYRAGRTTPLDVAEKVLSWAEESDRASPPLRVFIAQRGDDVRNQARASTERWRQGRPIGPLDGVPVAIKDELDQTPYPTTVGTRFLGAEPAAADATAVVRLRAAGALLVGKTNMHEIGLGVTGINPHHGTARNPYDPARAPGGSSSGSAAAVASGFCPIAIGADGGGSIRIPASFCGLVGLKPTFGRVSEHGAAPLCWSVAHVGPLAVSARDAALAYAAIAGPDPNDPNSRRQPAPTLDGWDAPDLKGVRVGVFRPWFEDADPAVVAACRAVLDGLVAAGAEVREIELPELGVLRTAHLVTIVGEMTAAQAGVYDRYRTAYGHETRVNLALARRIPTMDYVHAQRLRVRLSRHFARALGACDVIATPSTACTAPPLPEEALRTGLSDVGLATTVMRFAPAANLTGLPAISFPAGYDEAGLPIGFQAMGRPWSEALLLRLAAIAEGFVERRAPAVHRRLLPT